MPVGNRSVRRLPLLAPKFQTGRSSARRRGVIIVEFLFVMPLLFIQLLAILEFVFIGIATEAVTSAVVIGAREAALSYPTAFPFDDGTADPTGNNDIADRVSLRLERALAVVNLEVRQTGVGDNPARANAFVRVTRRPTAVLTQSAERGDTTLSGDAPHLGDAVAVGEAVVTVCVPLVDASAPSSGLGNPVPNWLAPVGFSLAGRNIRVTARAPLE